jgi:hypothetical protein
MSDNPTDDVAARQSHVADKVQRFVPGAFVGKPQRVIQRAVVVENQQIFGSRAKS